MPRAPDRTSETLERLPIIGTRSRCVRPWVFHVEFNGFNGVLEFLLWILGCIFVVYSRHGSPLLGDGV